MPHPPRRLRPRLSRLENKTTYTGTLLTDLSSASNTIIAQQLVAHVRLDPGPFWCTEVQVQLDRLLGEVEVQDEK